MRFLKCNNCGSLNEVKTEFLIFCQNCNKKLDNNFRDWQSRNPEKTFEEFKTLVCVSESEVNNNPVVKKNRPKSLKYWVGFAIALTISTIIGQFFGDKLIELIKFGKTPKSILEQKWVSEKYGQDGLIVETPFNLNSTQLPFPDNVKVLIVDCSSYITETSKGFMIMINSIRYKPEVGVLNLQGAANGSVAELKMQPGVSDFHYSEDYMYKDDIPGFSQKGTFIKDKVQMEFVNTCFANGLVFYQIMVGYKSDDSVAKQAAERVMKSIKIEKNKTAL